MNNIEIINYVATTTDGSSSYATTGQFNIPFFLFEYFFAIIMLTLLVIGFYLIYRKTNGN